MIRVVILLLLFNFSAQAQDLIPPNYTLKTTEDYKKYESNVNNCIHWLLTTPRSENTTKRSNIEDFVVKWIDGVPYLTVVMEPYAMQLAKKNPNLLLSFIFGYTAYQLEHPENKVLLPPNIACMESLINDYRTNESSFKKDEKIKELLALQVKGELNSWIKNQLTQSMFQN